MPRVTRYSQPKSDPPETVLQFLLRRFPYLSETQWRDHMTSGHLSLNGEPCGVADRVLAQGDMVMFQPPRTLEPHVDQEHIQVLLDDDAVLVCAKNGELPVTEGGRYCENTLMGVLTRSGIAKFCAYPPPGSNSHEDVHDVAAHRTLKRPREEQEEHVQNVDQDGASPQPPSLFPIHRLDKETSGLLVLGKTLSAAQTLSQQFEHQSTTLLTALSPLLAAATESQRCAQFAELMTSHKLVVKTYRAVVAGTAPVGTIRVVTQRIGKLSEDPVFSAHPEHQKLKKLKMACFPVTSADSESTPEKGKPAVSRITWLRSDPAHRLSLVEVSLLTGRTHQIRLHCAHLGFPIVGDKLYACRALEIEGGSYAVEDDLYMDRARRGETEMLPCAFHPTLLCKRHLLHSAHLAFQHPLTVQVVEVSSDAAPWFLRDVASDDPSLIQSLSILLEGF